QRVQAQGVGYVLGSRGHVLCRGQVRVFDRLVAQRPELACPAGGVLQHVDDGVGVEAVRRGMLTDRACIGDDDAAYALPVDVIRLRALGGLPLRAADVLHVVVRGLLAYLLERAPQV